MTEKKCEEVADPDQFSCGPRNVKQSQTCADYTREYNPLKVAIV